MQRYIDAGAVAFGKSNVAAYLIGWATQDEVYGTTNNLCDLGRSPGGSAGALATGVWTRS